MIFRSTAIIAAILTAAIASAAEPSAAKVRFLTEKLGGSTVQVRYFFKNDDMGRPPLFEAKYWCSNCEDYHSASLANYIEEQTPMTVTGFITGEKTIISTDTGILPGWIDRIEILQGDRAIPLTVSAIFPGRQALELTAQSPLPGTPLRFQPPELDEACYHFFVNQEDGILLAGVRAAADRVIRCLENQTDYAVGGANALLTDGDGNPVTLNFRNRRPLTLADNTPPAQWQKIPAADYYASLKAGAQQLAQSFYPVHVRLFVDEAANPMRRMYGAEKKNDFYSVGVLIAPELLLIPVMLDPTQTARLERVHVTMPDGRITDGRFAGSLREHGAFLVTVPAGGKPLPVAAKPAGQYYETTVYAVPARNNSGKLQLDLLPVNLDNFSMGRGGIPQPSPDSFKAGTDYLLNADNELMMIPAGFRAADKYSRSHEGATARKIRAAIDRKDFDSGNIPRSAEDRAVIAYLGVDFQELTEELVRVHNASAQTDDGDNGLLISRVRPGSPAQRAGLQTGDILLYIRSADSAQRVEVDDSLLSYSPFDDHPFPWDKLDELPEQLFDQLPPPWNTVENDFNKSLTTMGIGKEVLLGVIRKGAFSERKLTVEKAPVHYENAPRHHAAALGLTVADPTFEVREVIRLASGSAGVIISKIIPGSPAAVAGLKPFEVIVSVNDKAVFSAEDFAAAVKDLKDPVFSVRRMAAVRTVKLSTAPAAKEE